MQVFSNYFKCIISKRIYFLKTGLKITFLNRYISKGGIEEIFKEPAHRNTTGPAGFTGNSTEHSKTAILCYFIGLRQYNILCLACSELLVEQNLKPNQTKKKHTKIKPIKSSS